MNYFVVAFEHGDPMLRRYQFNEIGCRLVRESMERVAEEMQCTGDSAFVNSLKRVETYTFGDAMPGYEDSLPEWAKSYFPTEEYKKFGKVYFLNDLALQMYEEGGIAFEVYKVINAEELPPGCTQALSAPYLPKKK